VNRMNAVPTWKEKKPTFVRLDEEASPVVRPRIAVERERIAFGVSW